MSKYKFPAIIPRGSKILLTQGFTYHPTNNILGHAGIDWCAYDYSKNYADNQVLTYGVKFVMPFDSICAEADDFGTMQEKGNGVRMRWLDKDGFWYDLLFWHTIYNEVSKGDLVPAGKVVGLMGNTGSVKPIVTKEAPYNGTHCHMELWRFNKNSDGGHINIVLLDASLYFDMNDVYGYEDGFINEVDGIPLKWAFPNVMDRLLYIIKHFFQST